MTAIADAMDLLSLKLGSSVNLDTVASLLLNKNGGVEPEVVYQHKDAMANGVAAATGIPGMATSLWEYQGTPQSHGVAPTTWANPTRATTGGLLQANATGGRSKYLWNAIAASQVGGYLTLYDRLAHGGGYSGTSITTQNVNGGADGGTTRYTNGVGNQIWIEISSAVGATGRSLNVNYKNGAGTSQTSPAITLGGTDFAEAQRMLPVSLAAGDNTVSSVSSLILSASTGTAGSFNVVIAHPLCTIPLCTLDSAFFSNFLNGPMPQILTDACLGLMFVPLSAQPTIEFTLMTVEL